MNLSVPMAGATAPGGAIVVPMAIKWGQCFGDIAGAALFCLWSGRPGLPRINTGPLTRRPEFARL